MIVNMSNNATPDEINHIIDRIRECGFQAHVVQGEERTIIGAVGSSGRRSEIEALRAAPGVAEVIQISHPFKLVSRQLRQTRTVVDVRGTKIGARNMQNFSLLRKLACVAKPVLLKRGPSATVKEWLLAAEYLLAGGNANVVLCERGIKTFETATRNTLDLAAVALVKELSHLPVLADPSHGTGLRSLITPMSKAAAAAGADGLLIEVHPCPERALSDGPQSLDLQGFQELMDGLGLRQVREAKAA